MAKWATLLTTLAERVVSTPAALAKPDNKHAQLKISGTRAFKLVS